MSDIILVILQIIVALELLNVWIIRFNKETPYRGGGAPSMRAEFAAYGLPEWFVYVVGTLKVGAAVALIAGLWVSQLILPAAALVVVLMLGALAMHVKIKDPLKKSLPALAMLALSAGVCFGSLS